MADVSPDTERLVDDAIQQLEANNYRRDHLSQGLFLMALDLKNNHSAGQIASEPFLLEAIDDVLREQDEWVIDHLRTSDLPEGFAEDATRGKIDFAPFDEDPVDHEFLMHPGDDLVEMMIRGYYQVLCGDRSLQSVTQQTKENKYASRDIAMMLLSGAGLNIHIAIPIVSVFAFYVAEQNIDRVCEEYEPW